MKRKIVYISGAESFDIMDVKAAFEEVRNTLKLDSDTLLFGVPVEEFVAVSDKKASDKNDSVVTNVAHETVTDVIEEPVVSEKPKKTSRKKEVEKVTEEPVVEQTADVAVPILSILSSNTPIQEEKTAPETEDTITEIKDEEEKEEIIDSQDDIIPEEVLDNTDPDFELDEVADMVKDDVPVDETEKTLEELLEKMEPLREDTQPEQKEDLEKEIDFQSDSGDSTLESLASEFVENQDNLLPPKKNAQRSKIGKLKNILPFKKMKREDPGIMGDLFGWAGIAANDEDFTIPGFFTGVASKK